MREREREEISERGKSGGEIERQKVMYLLY